MCHRQILNTRELENITGEFLDREMIIKKFEIEVKIKDNHPKDDLKWIIYRLEDTIKKSVFEWRNSFKIKEIKD